MGKLLRSKRGVSPVVTSLFLMAIIFGAIAFALTIIYPNVQTLNDQLDLEGNALNLLILDENLRSLMLSGQSGTIYQEMDLGDSGAVLGDNFSTSTIFFKYRTTDETGAILDDQQWPTSPSAPTQFNETQYRFIIRQSIDDDFFERNSYTYLIGGIDQNMFYLNDTTKAVAPWTIINQSRYSDFFIYSVLSYRNIISAERVIDVQTLTINYTISVQRVQFLFKDDITFNSDSIQYLSAEYQGINVTTHPWITIPNAGTNDRVFYMTVNTDLWDVDTITGSLSSSENPFYQDVPTNGQLNVRIQFVDHIVEFNLG